MAIKGSLAEAALSNVIQLLTISMKSGCLSVTDGKNFGNIFIEDGKIIFATILNRKQRFGDILISKGEIDNNTLVRALDIQKNQRKKKIGEILIEIGAITRKVMENELKEQIEQTIFTMLTWDSGYFNFEAGLLPSSEEFTVRLSPQEVLLEAARRIDEWRKIENKMPSFSAVLKPTVGVSSLPLTKEEKKIIELIDGKRTIDQVLSLSGYEFFETCRAIYGLLSAGYLEKPEEPVKGQPDISEQKNLGVGFYQTAMLSEAEREFNKILEIDGNDVEALFYLGLIESRKGNYQKAREILVKAAAQENRLPILINLGYLCNRLELYDEAIDYLNRAKELAPEDPKVRCNLGIAFYKKGNLDRAHDLFTQVMEKSRDFLTPYTYLSVIHFRKRDLDAALKLLNDALQKFPDVGALKNNLAVIYESLAKPNESEKYYRQALELDPKSLTLYRNLANFYYDSQILGAARELFEKVPEGMWDWQILFRLGNIYLRMGESKRALELWERARVLNPSEEQIIDNIKLLKRSDLE